MINLSDQRAVRIVEAALARPILPIDMPEVPLADNRRLVSRLFERLWQQPLIGGKAVPSGGGNDCHLQSVTQRIASRHQRRARGRANLLGVELFQSSPGLSSIV